MPIRKLNATLAELTGAEMARVRPLVDAAPPTTHTLLGAVLEGYHVGRVFVDDPERPTAAMAHLICDYTFLMGDAANDAFIHATGDLLLGELAPTGPYGQMLFLIPTSEAWHTRLSERYAADQVTPIARKAFTFDPDLFAARQGDWRDRVPETYTLRPYDRELATSAEGLAEFWGSLDTFMAHGFGFAVMHAGAPVSRCHAVLRTRREVEISIDTEEAYRRRGLATLACSAFIDHALRQDLTPSWSCWDNNEASILLAHRLGFSPAPDVPVLLVVKPPEASDASA